MSNSPVKTALCSFGMSGKVFHAPFLNLLDEFILLGSWERSTKTIQQHYPGVRSYNTYDELLADDEVELVIVNTPNITHYDFAKKALLAGKHVMIEKPFSVTSAEGNELIALAKQNDKKLTAYQNRRWDSDFLTVKDVLQKKLLGNVVEAEIHFDRFVETLSYKAHKEEAVLGTGLVYDLGSHIIDQALQLFGTPKAVFGDIRIVRPISRVDDYFEIIFYYPQLRVRVKSTLVARENEAGYIFHGTKGSFLKPKTNIQEEGLAAGKLPIGADWGKESESSWGLLHTEKNGAIIRERIPSVQGNYTQLFKQLYQAIRHGANVPVLPEDAVQVIKVIEAAFESNKLGKVINLY